MKLVITYLFLFLLGILYVAIFIAEGNLPSYLEEAETFLYSGITGGIGGVVYCLRAVYLNRCVKNEWNKHWEVWYYIRPVVSILMGFISFIFLSAGLLILEAQEMPDSTSFGFLALAFIAGLNVDNFIKKLESIAAASWGVQESNASKKP